MLPLNIQVKTEGHPTLLFSNYRYKKIRQI